MTRLMRRMVWMMSGGAVALVASGCATATPASTRPLPALATLGRPSAVLNHIAPARDSMGSLAARNLLCSATEKAVTASIRHARPASRRICTSACCRLGKRLFARKRRAGGSLSLDKRA